MSGAQMILYNSACAFWYTALPLLPLFGAMGSAIPLSTVCASLRSTDFAVGMLQGCRVIAHLISLVSPHRLCLCLSLWTQTRVRVSRCQDSRRISSCQVKWSCFGILPTARQLFTIGTSLRTYERSHSTASLNVVALSTHHH